MLRKKCEFDVTDADGVKREFIALRPSHAVRAEADIVKSRAWGRYAMSGVTVSSKLKDIVAQQGLWGEDKQKELDAIDAKMARLEDMIPDANGKVRAKGVKLADAKKAAFELGALRGERIALLGNVTRLSGNTAEAKADQDELDFLLTRCLLDAKTEKPVFASVEDYYSQADEPWVEAAAEKFAVFYNNHDPEWFKSLPENQFLIKRGFVDPETMAPKSDAPAAAEPELYELEEDPAVPGPEGAKPEAADAQ